MIHIRHLRKEYEGNVALKNLHLDVPKGEVYGLIGPNGAGKTTLLRILATLLEPTYGLVTIGGYDVVEQPLKVHRLIGYMSDVFAVYENMLVWEYLDHFARCHGVDTRKRRLLVDEVLELVSLTVRKEAEIKSLSRGMRQRLCLAKTLIHEPELLLLDEPASGMDPAGRIEFREMLKSLQAMGRTVVISSHILTEMADFCSSIGILEQGELRVSGRVGDILTQLQPGLQLDLEIHQGLEQARSLLQTHPSVQQLAQENGKLKCRWLADRTALPDLHRQLVQNEVALIAMAVKEDNLEDIYMKISGHRTA